MSPAGSLGVLFRNMREHFVSVAEQTQGRGVLLEIYPRFCPYQDSYRPKFLGNDKSNSSATTFQSFWYGSELSARERLCLTSFVNHGLGFELYTYDSSLSVPDGVVLRDASDVYPESEVFTYQEGPGKGSVSVFANFFRYKLLYERGGWWVDTDVLYTGGSLPTGEFFAREDESNLNVAVLRFPEKSAVMKKCLEKARSLRSDASKEWGKTGPRLFTEVLEEEDRKDEAFPAQYAYPIRWEEAEAFYLPSRKKEVEKKSKEGPFLHLWNEILRRMGIHKSLRPPSGSYLEKKAEELNVTWPCPHLQYSAKTIDQMAENLRQTRRQASRAERLERQLENIRSSRTWKVASHLRSVSSGVKSMFGKT